MDLVQINKWQLQDGTVLHTQQVFSKLMMKEITPITMCRSEKSDWQPLQNMFKTIDRYGILKELGEGAFGKVYLGLEVQKKEGRFVAIKMPTKRILDEYTKESQRSSGEDQVSSRMAIGQLFSQESLLTARLAMCPHVVKVLDHNVTAPYMVLEYCNGGSLDERITQVYTKQEFLQWAYEISSALAAAHGLLPDALIHRDLKPQNILLHDGKVKVSDFGTSQMTYQSESLRSLHGGYTPKYASPEALNGKAHPNTDVWSLGVILYLLVSKTFPFEADGMLPLMKKIAHDDFIPVAQKRKMDVDDRVCEFIDKCLQKDPKNRPSSKECVAFFSSDQSEAVEIPKVHTARRTKPARRDSVVTRRRMSKAQQTTKKTSMYVIGAAMLAICGVLSFFMMYFADTSKYPSPQIKKIFDITSKTNFDTTPSGVGVIYTRKSPGQDWTVLAKGDSMSQQHDYYFGFQLQSQAYAYIFQIDTKGKVFWVFPKNDTSPEFSVGKNPVNKDDWYHVPEGYYYKLDNTLGLEHVYMVFSPKRWLELENALREASGNNEQMRSARITKSFAGQRIDERRGIGKIHDLVAPPRNIKVTNPKSSVFRLISGESGVLVIEYWFHHVSGS